MAGPQSSVREFVIESGIWGVFIRVEDRSVECGPVVPAPDTPESPRSALFPLGNKKEAARPPWLLVSLKQNTSTLKLTLYKGFAQQTELGSRGSLGVK